MGQLAEARGVFALETRLSEDLPVVVEIVDTKDRLDAYLESIDESIQAGMVTLEQATVRLYRGEWEEVGYFSENSEIFKISEFFH